MTDFKGKVVLITGAGKGSGRKLAEAFAKYGATVAANDISPINVEEAVEEIRARGEDARAYIDDIAKKVGAQALVKQVEDDLGHIDILINHASVEPHFSLLDMDEWDWHRVLDVNLTGAFLMTQSVGRMMREQGGGVIINLLTPDPGGTVAGHDGSSPALTRVDTDQAEYGGPGKRAAFFVSMSALESLSQQAARELAPYGIRVYSVTSDTDIETILDLCRS
jgi:NAD(P)-dependent dehydrogenase (short-subunit alcohol dehydrogenase family)